MTAGFLDGNVFRGLAFRILVFLSLALLPIGLIAIVQTREIARQSDINSELSLLALTEQSSAAEKAIIQEGFGVARALTSIVRLYVDDLSACKRFMREYQRASGFYSLVGFLPVDGNMVCSSSDKTYDFSTFDTFEDMMASPRRRATASHLAPMSQQSVLVLQEPFYDDEQFLGYLTLSVPLKSIVRTPPTDPARAPLELMTFSPAGTVLTSAHSVEEASTELPLNRNLTLLFGSEPTAFTDTNEDGDQRVYAVVPIVKNVVYAMGVWSDNAPIAQIERKNSLSTFLHVIMWIASLIVAFWALNRLAIRHIKKLGRQMRHFAFNRTLPRAGMGIGVPREIVDMEQAFVGMAESIIRDEASLEDSLRQKNILLKEVHHRVKNNLQLISSIMNMQIRQARSEDARFVLRRLQERILSLATVHKSLYQDDDVESVDGGALIKEIVGQQLTTGLPAGSDVAVNQTYEPILLEPDDAAPLSLMVSEAVTNALKYLGKPDDGQAELDVVLKYTDAEMAMLEVNNTIGLNSASPGTGLGSQLITAFARQLNGQVEIEEKDGWHKLTLRFPVPRQRKQMYDY